MSSPEFPSTLKRITLWLLLGTALFLAVQTFLSESNRPRVMLAGGAVELERRTDGHFHWPGQLNGEPVDFLVDTGATRTAIPESLARRLGLVSEGSVHSMTAGGPVEGWVGRATLKLEGGVRAEQLPLTVLPGLTAPLLGMDVLSRMPFSQRDGVLRFELGGSSN